MWIAAFHWLRAVIIHRISALLRKHIGQKVWCPINKGPAGKGFNNFNFKGVFILECWKKKVKYNKPSSS